MYYVLEVSSLFSRISEDHFPPSLLSVDDLIPLSPGECDEKVGIFARVDSGHERQVESLKVLPLRPQLLAPLSDGHRELVEVEMLTDVAHSDGELPREGLESGHDVRLSLGDSSSLWPQGLLLSKLFVRSLLSSWLFLQR